MPGISVTMWGVIKKSIFFSALVALAIVSLAPQEALPDTGISDKLGHFIAYGALSLMGLYAYPGKFAQWSVILGLVAYGSALEGLQILVPSRSFSIADIFANTLGVFGGYALIALTCKMRRPVSR